MRKYLKYLSIILGAIGVLLASNIAYAAQIVIVSPVGSDQEFVTESGIVWTTPLIGYSFYVNDTPNEAGAIYYTKTLDGGLTWAAGVQVSTAAVTTSRIDNFNVWFDPWTPGVSTRIIWIAWMDAIADDVHIRPLITNTSPPDTFGTDVQISTLPLFTRDVSHCSHGVFVTRARGGNLYVSARHSGAQRFFRSIDDGVNWTTRTVGPSTLVAKGWLAPGAETDPEDVYAIDAACGDTSVEIWQYDDSGNSWNVLGAITTIATTSSGHNPSAVAVDGGSAHTFFGVRDEEGASSATFFVREVFNGTLSNIPNVFTAEINHDNRIALLWNDVDNILYATYVNTSGTDSPAYKTITSGASGWSTETSVAASDNMNQPATAPAIPVFGGRYAPMFNSTDAGNDSLELESGINAIIQGVEISPEQEDTLASNIRQMLETANYAGVSGEQIFALITTVFLAVILAVLRVSGPLMFAIIGLWIGGLAIADFIPRWTILVGALLVGTGVLLFATRGSTSEE